MNLVLAPCPNCSSAIFVERPYWRYAMNTSERRKLACYSLSGCKHVREAVDCGKIRDDPEEMNFVSDEWARVSEELFKVYTEGWSESVVAAFRVVLEERSKLAPPEPEFTLETEPPPPKHIGDYI